MCPRLPERVRRLFTIEERRPIAGLPSGLAKAVTPITAFSLRRAIVAGSSRLTLAALICCFKASGNASESTLRPTDSAVFGETPGPTPPFFSPAMALCS